MDLKTAPPVDISNATLPIFFFHSGGKPGTFLKKVLQQAQKTNGADNVFILTDTNFDFYKGINCIDISGYIKSNTKFDNLYKHHSTNTPAFERACFDRWFVMNALTKDLNITYFFHADCDVLLLQDIKPIYLDTLINNYDGSTMYYQYDSNSITCGHSSFWSSKLLTNFCDFVYSKYADAVAFDKLLKDTREGKFLDNRNVSDMILLDLFRTETKPNVLNLLSLEEKNMVFDFNINVPYNGYKYSFALDPFFKIKKLLKYNNEWYGRVESAEKDIVNIKFYSLHFQGYLTKSLIPIYISHTSANKSIGNNILGTLTFLIRKTKLLKTHIKDTIKSYLNTH
jgi:hypothetical protein